MTRRAAVVGALATAGGYAWLASGVRPFTLTAYFLVAWPTVALMAAWWRLRPSWPRGNQQADQDSTQERARRRFGPGDGPRHASSLPWVGLFVLAVALELAGLSLGGRSATVPTLSTVVDRGLSAHGGRFGLYVAWLAVGWAPAAAASARMRRRSASKGSA